MKVRHQHIIIIIITDIYMALIRKMQQKRQVQVCTKIIRLLCIRVLQESPANAKGTRDSSACMKAHCEQM